HRPRSRCRPPSRSRRPAGPRTRTAAAPDRDRPGLPLPSGVGREREPPSPLRPSSRGHNGAMTSAVDLRSDTLTMPGPEMRRAMADAEIGDAVYGEDPSVNRLEERAAEAMGKAAAVFVASGTMGNLLGVLSQARSGDEVIADADAHVFIHEGAGAAAL